MATIDGDLTVDVRAAKNPFCGFANAPDVRENAILIYGPRKAGTTLLQRLIDGSTLYVYPAEYKLKKLSTATWSNKTKLLKKCKQINRLSGQHLNGFDHVKFEKETSESLAQASCLRDAILLEIQAAINSSPKGEWTGWAVKEVGGDFSVILNDWKKMFPDSRLVVIARNPFHVSRSVFRARRRAKIQLGLKDIVRQIIQPWLVTKTIIDHLDRSDLYLLYYEDIVSDTESQMNALANFLGIKFHPAMTYPTLFGEPTIVSTSSSQENSVFNKQQQSYWSELAVKEAVLLTVIGGACYILNRMLGRVRFEHGKMRLTPRDRVAAP